MNVYTPLNEQQIIFDGTVDQMITQQHDQRISKAILYCCFPPYCFEM